MGLDLNIFGFICGGFVCSDYSIVFVVNLQ